MKKAIVLLVIVIAVFAVVLFFGKNKREDVSKNTVAQPSVSPLPQYETKKDDQALVEIEITPIKISTAENSNFKVLLNTHSAALDKDLKDVSSMIDDKGNEYKAVSWDGGTGGHHLEGTLVFPALKNGAESVTLTIKGIANTDRVFSWNL